MQHPNESPFPARHEQPPPGSGTTEERSSALADGRESGGPLPGARQAPQRVRRSAAERAALIEAFHASGQGAAAFAAEHGIPYSTFTSWLRPTASPKRAPKRKRRRFTPEERREAVEQWRKSGRTAQDFARLWNCSASSLQKWAKRYDEDGPKSLEDRPHPKGRRAHHPRRLPDQVRQAIREIRERNPSFGVTRVADELRRTAHVNVSPSTVRNVLLEAGFAMQPSPKKRRRGPDKLRRFERARPGELWQTDITSFVLRRHGVRTYLTVFLDDHSRFVVAWKLATHCRKGLVIEPLMEGIARFGKPKEVLTDQGPQYFTWRGKSAFHGVLQREGIQQVLARSHHPQTLGKCERLWKTIGLEFWDRAAPQDLDEARERLGHWIDHYNFFRPHQGIGGSVPADRFFGADETVREAIAEQVSRNALDLALGEVPRKSVYLTGRIGDQSVAVHGEHGGLTVKLPDGSVHEMSSAELGCSSNPLVPAPDPEPTTTDDRNAPEPARIPGTEAEAQADEPQACGVPQGAAPGVERAGPVGERAATDARGSAPDVHDDPVLLAGEGVEGGGGEAAGGDAAAGVAAEPGGAVGDDGGPAPAAADEGAAGGLREEAGGVAHEPGEAGAAAGGGAVADGGPGAGAENGPVERPSYGVDLERRNGPCPQEDRNPQEEDCPATSEPGSEPCSRSSGSRIGRWWRSLTSSR
jgi:transposase InsO family protein